ncbi:hypothetical protein ACFSB1_09010 [Halopseudomonas phragmitis]|uniref:Copper resistance protein D domain-containing protein n=1 Tax=Halopseudomonas phragmitis TaxID=1931241 RepID=A0A1V0B8M5_9GAMM|nr:hypothetical protein [Halopseudomonas phragmitis]AQZ96250.1 hypothetical protein BVH74_16485 [Halopseudomonas phragmitis]
MTYLLLKSLHLLMAIAFIGALFFQVLILWPAVRELEPASRTRLAELLGQRARHVIHWVALLLYGAGIALAWPYRRLLADPLATTFGTLLSLKILLALLIIGHYLALIVLRRRQLIAERGMHWLNVSLLLHAVLLVICAKAMFVL